MSRADGVSGIRNRGISKGSDRRARGTRPAPQAVPARIKRPDPSPAIRTPARSWRRRTRLGGYTLGVASTDAGPGGQSCRNQRASALPGSAISLIELYHAASQPAAGRPVNSSRLSG